jgi:hypothetical protein
MHTGLEEAKNGFIRQAAFLTHRLVLQRRRVHTVGGVKYLKINDAGLHTRVNGEPGYLTSTSLLFVPVRHRCESPTTSFRRMASKRVSSAAPSRQQNSMPSARSIRRRGWRR